MKALFNRPVALAVSVLLFAMVLASCGTAASAQQTDQQKAGVLLNAGLAAHNAGRLSEASTDYKQVIALDPQNKWARYNLGLIEQLTGQNAAAENDYRAVLAVDPTFVGALYNLAILRTATAPAEAADLYRKAIAISPNLGSAHLNLGFLLINQGNTIDGKAELEKAVAIEPTLAQRIPKGLIPAKK